MCSQNGIQGMGKLVAKHCTSQGLGGRACGLKRRGQSVGLVVFLAQSGHCVGTVWAQGRGANGGGSSVGVQHCRGVSAMQGGSAPGTAAAAAGRALAQGGHPVRAMSQTGVGGNGKEQCVCSEEGNRSCWRRVWGCLVTVQRGGCCAAVAVRRGWALPGAARGFLHCSTAWAETRCPSDCRASGAGSAPQAVQEG